MRAGHGGCPEHAFELLSSPAEDIMPIRDIVPGDNGVTVSYSFPGAVITEDDLYPDTYNVSIPGFGNNMEPGMPGWPQRWDSFVIPEGCDANFTLLSVTTETKQFHLAPARRDLPNSVDIVYTKENVLPVAPYSGLMPENCIERGNIRIYRDRRIIYVKVCPVSYRQEDGTVIVAESLSYRVDFSESTRLKSNTSDNVLHEVDDSVMSSLFTYYDNRDERMSDIMRASSAPSSADLYPAPYYLILSVPNYKEEVERFAAWKRIMGFNIKIEYKTTWSPSSIRSTVQKNYNELSRLQYLLIVGDEADLPGLKKSYYDKDNDKTYVYYTDYLYACMDGENDSTPDLYVGRLSVSSNEELKSVVDKIIKYEKDPPKDKSFYSKGIHCAEFSDDLITEEHKETGKTMIKAIPDCYEDRRFTRTSEDIRNGLLEEGFDIERIYFYHNNARKQYPNAKPLYWNKDTYASGEEIPAELKIPKFSWNGSLSDFMNAVDRGVLYVLYRGHGEWNKWQSPDANSKDLEYLANGNLTPVVFSINCNTGMFQRSDSETSIARTQCFAESFLVQPDKGCVGIISACQESYSGFNDVLTMEMFSGIWPNADVRVAFRNYTPNRSHGAGSSVQGLGAILEKGGFGLDDYFSWDEEANQYTKQIFHCFGDPSMKMYTAYPKATPYSCSLPKFGMSERYVDISSPIFIQIVKVYKSGKVETAYANKFTVPLTDEDYLLYVCKENMIPQKVVYGFTALLPEPLPVASIKSVARDGENLRIKYEYNAEPEADVMIEMYSIANDYSLGKQYECDIENLCCDVNVSNLKSGVYVLQLVVDGVVTDRRKIILK